MRTIDLNEFPKMKRGDRYVYDCVNSVGCTARFTYDDISGSLTIEEYNKESGTFTVLYNNNQCNIFSGHLWECKLEHILGMIKNEYLYDAGDCVGECDVIKRIRIPYRTHHGVKNLKGYILKCKVDGYEYEVSENNLNKKSKCPVCTNKKTLRGVNSIYDTDRWMCEYIVNEEDWYKYTKSSGEKIKVKCDICGAEKYQKIFNLNNYGVKCICGDGVSYPNKFIFNMLRQLNIQFSNEKSFKWSGSIRYDNYILETKCIIENHGGQHYGDGWGNGKTVEEERDNDKLKHDLALENGIKHYITLDCRYSELEWVKNSVMNSKLPNILNFKEEDIDWIECEKFALSNIVKEVCELWMHKEMSSDVISNKFGISRVTLIKYLKCGAIVGWCNYDPVEEKRKSGRARGLASGREVAMFNKNGVCMGTFKNCTELSRLSEELFGLKLCNSKISTVCRGERKHHRGFVFKYV